MDVPPPYDHIVFDCDSTLSTLEGIDELAGDHPEVVRLTDEAMSGRVPMEAVYGRRLEILKPSLEELEAVGQRYIETALPGARELIAAIRKLGKRVSIVSGGLLEPVRIFGRFLGVDTACIHAVPTHHGPDGVWAGFAEDAPLARMGGKPEVIARISRPRESAALVGDGATDLEAAESCARFIAFGGVVRREGVFAGAAVTSEARDLRELAPLLLEAREMVSSGLGPPD